MKKFIVGSYELVVGGWWFRVKTTAILLLLYTLYAIPSNVSAEVKIEDEFGFGHITTLGDVISKVVPAIFSIAALIVIIWFLIGAYNYITSAGDKEKVSGARGQITHAIIGLILLLLSYIALPFIFSSLGLGFILF